MKNEVARKRLDKFIFIFKPQNDKFKCSIYANYFTDDCVKFPNDFVCDQEFKDGILDTNNINHVIEVLRSAKITLANDDSNLNVFLLEQFLTEHRSTHNMASYFMCFCLMP